MQRRKEDPAFGFFLHPSATCRAGAPWPRRVILVFPAPFPGTLSKNRRASAARVPYYHVLVGLQHNKCKIFSRLPLFFRQRRPFFKDTTCKLLPLCGLSSGSPVILNGCGDEPVGNCRSTRDSSNPWRSSTIGQNYGLTATSYEELSVTTATATCDRIFFGAIWRYLVRFSAIRHDLLREKRPLWRLLRPGPGFCGGWSPTFNAKTRRCNGPARQAATKDEMAAKEHKDHKRVNNVSSYLCVPCVPSWQNFVKKAKLFGIALQRGILPDSPVNDKAPTTGRFPVRTFKEQARERRTISILPRCRGKSRFIFSRESGRGPAQGVRGMAQQQVPGRRRNANRFKTKAENRANREPLGIREKPRSLACFGYFAVPKNP